MVGDYPALDDRIMELIIFMRTNGVSKLRVSEDFMDIEFNDSAPPSRLSEFDPSGPDETSYYSYEKDKN